MKIFQKTSQTTSKAGRISPDQPSIFDESESASYALGKRDRPEKSYCGDLGSRQSKQRRPVKGKKDEFLKEITEESDSYLKMKNEIFDQLIDMQLQNIKPLERRISPVISPPKPLRIKKVIPMIPMLPRTQNKDKFFHPWTPLEERAAKFDLRRTCKSAKVLTAKYPAIQYPEDLLTRTLSSENSLYINLKNELAYPLSAKIILRNEVIIELKDLLGRMLKVHNIEDNSIRNVYIKEVKDDESIEVKDLENEGKVSTFTPEIYSIQDDKEKIVLIQSPVFLDLRAVHPAVEALRRKIKEENLEKYCTFQIGGEDELLWPCFLVQGRSTQATEALLSSKRPSDSLNLIDLNLPTFLPSGSITSTPQKGGYDRKDPSTAIIWLFGLNLYIKTNVINLLPFEECFELYNNQTYPSKGKVKDLEKVYSNYFALSKGYFNAIGCSMITLTKNNYVFGLHRLVIIERKKGTQTTRQFGILLA